MMILYNRKLLYEINQEMLKVHKRTASEISRNSLLKYNKTILKVFQIQIVVYTVNTICFFTMPIANYYFLETKLLFMPMRLPYVDHESVTGYLILLSFQVILILLASFCMFIMDFAVIMFLINGISYMEDVRNDFDNITRVILKNSKKLDHKKISILLKQAIQSSKEMTRSEKYVLI